VGNAEVIRAYKAQAGVEGGSDFSKTTVLCVVVVCEKTCAFRLLMVMTLATACVFRHQRRLRQQWHAKTRPCQTKSINRLSVRPCVGSPAFEGIHRVRVMVQGQVHDLIEGSTMFRSKSFACLEMRSVDYIKFSRVGLLNVGSIITMLAVMIRDRDHPRHDGQRSKEGRLESLLVHPD